LGCTTVLSSFTLTFAMKLRREIHLSQYYCMKTLVWSIKNMESALNHPLSLSLYQVRKCWSTSDISRKHSLEPTLLKAGISEGKIPLNIPIKFFLLCVWRIILHKKRVYLLLLFKFYCSAYSSIWYPSSFFSFGFLKDAFFIFILSQTIY
jgi:hypothetical protein